MPSISYFINWYTPPRSTLFFKCYVLVRALQIKILPLCIPTKWFKRHSKSGGGNIRPEKRNFKKAAMWTADKKIACSKWTTILNVIRKCDRMFMIIIAWSISKLRRGLQLRGRVLSPGRQPDGRGVVRKRQKIRTGNEEERLVRFLTIENNWLNLWSKKTQLFWCAGKISSCHFKPLQYDLFMHNAEFKVMRIHLLSLSKMFCLRKNIL